MDPQPPRPVTVADASPAAPLRRAWLDVCAGTAPDVEALPALLTERLDALAAAGALDEPSLLVVAEDAAHLALEAGAQDVARQLSKRLRRAIYEFLLTLDALSLRETETAAVEMPRTEAPRRPGEVLIGLEEVEAVRGGAERFVPALEEVAGADDGVTAHAARLTWEEEPDLAAERDAEALFEPAGAEDEDLDGTAAFDVGDADLPGHDGAGFLEPATGAEVDGGLPEAIAVPDAPEAVGSTLEALPDEDVAAAATLDDDEDAEVAPASISDAALRVPEEFRRAEPALPDMPAYRLWDAVVDDAAEPVAPLVSTTSESAAAAYAAFAELTSNGHVDPQGADSLSVIEGSADDGDRGAATVEDGAAAGVHPDDPGAWSPVVLRGDEPADETADASTAAGADGGEAEVDAEELPVEESAGRQPVAAEPAAADEPAADDHAWEPAAEADVAPVEESDATGVDADQAADDHEWEPAEAEVVVSDEPEAPEQHAAEETLAAEPVAAWEPAPEEATVEAAGALEQAPAVPVAEHAAAEHVAVELAGEAAVDVPALENAADAEPTDPEPAAWEPVVEAPAVEPAPASATWEPIVEAPAVEPAPASATSSAPDADDEAWGVPAVPLAPPALSHDTLAASAQPVEEPLGVPAVPWPGTPPPAPEPQAFPTSDWTAASDDAPSEPAWAAPAAVWNVRTPDSVPQDAPTDASGFPIAPREGFHLIDPATVTPPPVSVPGWIPAPVPVDTLPTVPAAPVVPAPPPSAPEAPEAAPPGGWSVRQSPRQQQLAERMAQKRREEAVRAAMEAAQIAAALAEPDRKRRRRGSSEPERVPDVDTARTYIEEHLRRKRGAEAAALLQRAAQEIGGRAVADLALDVGDRCRILGQSRAATNCYIAGWRADPVYEAPLWRLADVCLTDRDVELAVGYLERIAELMRSRGDDEGAVAVYRKIVTVAPDRNDIRSLLALAQTTGRLGE